MRQIVEPGNCFELIWLCERELEDARAARRLHVARRARVASASDGPSTSSHHGRTPVFFFGSVKLPSDLPHFAYCTGTCEQPAERAATYWNIGSRRQRSSHLNFDQDARPRHLRLHRGTHRLIIRIHPIVPYLRILHTKNESSDASAQHSCTAKTYSVHSLEIGGNVLQPDGRI